MYRVSFGVNSYAQSARAMTPKFGVTTAISGWNDWLQSQLRTIPNDADYYRMLATLPDNFAQQLDDRYSQDHQRIVAGANLLTSLRQKMATTAGREQKFYDELHRVALSEITYRVLQYPKSPIPSEVSQETRLVILRHIVEIDHLLETLDHRRTIGYVRQNTGRTDLGLIGRWPANVLIQSVRAQIESVLTQNHDVFKALLISQNPIGV